MAAERATLKDEIGVLVAEVQRGDEDLRQSMTENKQLIDINLCYPRLIKADGYPNNTLSSILFLQV